MKFTIITPTYKRAEKLTRAVDSVLSQTYPDWEMIIVNDSPDDKSYADFASSINDPRIHYHVNDSNMGVNYSRNFAMEKASAYSTWTVFLDDDDYFAPDALMTLHDLITSHPENKWLVTNRAYKNGKPVTSYPSPDREYSYILDCLLFKRCKGDATHCMETKFLIHNKIKYSKYIKQAEEWLFYYQASLKEKFYYHDHNSTITDGYDMHHGLNFRKRTKQEQLETIFKFIYEGQRLNLIKHPTFIMYLLMRCVRLLLK
jgi:glycosyltransferase involved in cell wall biosynthesis